ncbi:DUF6049 family protein [Nocardia callitridis]|uniref:Glycoprotein n=1 Tax=Nocardia callitridis TaxID=648753 RepID=A0ABP9JWP2_9NOCA
MTRGLFRIIVAVLTILGSVTTFPLLSTAVAAAQPAGSGTSSTPQFLKLSLDSVSPNTVTTTSDPVLTVSGTVTNIGDRAVNDVSIRVQRAGAVGNPAELRGALRLDQVNYDVATPFEDIAEQLSPGERKQFTLSVAVRSDGSAPSSLEIDQPGVYPLLLNVNGAPEYGTQARLDDARFLLPVLGIPPSADVDPADPTAQPVAAASDAPVATTLLWPLADRPRLVAGHPGSVKESVELTDDELAASLGKGGRLDQLLSALEEALGASGSRDHTLASSVCLAIDPDLLMTVQSMTKGYRVLASPSDPDGATREGTGEQQAQAWLDRVRAVAGTLCTVALPFGQVDLPALAAVNDQALTDRAVNSPADLVDSILSVRSVRGVSLPDSGSIDAGAGTLLRDNGFSTAVLADNVTVPEGTSGTSQELFDEDQNSEDDTGYHMSMDGPTEPAAPAMVRLPGVTPTPPPVAANGRPDPAEGTQTGPVNGTPTASGEPPTDPALHAATFDIWSATALAAIGSNPPTPSFTPNRVRYDVTNDSRSARMQDALGAVSWSALNPQPDRPRSLLLVPPQQWGANREEAAALLAQLELLMRNHLATPKPLPELLAQPVDPQSYELDTLPQVVRDAVPGQFLAPVRDQSLRIKDLMRALVEVPEVEPTPQQFLAPLRDDLIRVLSRSDRRPGDNTQSDTFAQRRLDQTATTMENLYRSVTVLPPGGVYTLASEQSPLLLVARNDLPVAIRIRFRIEAPEQTKITDLGEEQLPPRGSRSFQIPTEVTDSRKLVIPISLNTPDGIPLGNATSVSVRSNAYGQALAIITGCAGALLFLLAGRRLWRRFRGRPDPNDEGFDAEIGPRVSRYRQARKRLLRENKQEQQ